VAKIAWSAQSRRGLGFVRRGTATSCRNTSSSMSLVEDERPSIRISPGTCWKIRYDNVRHEALLFRMEVRDLRCSAVVAVG